MATPADVKRIAPEFSSLDDATVIQPFINDAAGEISPDAWGSKADRVIALLAAHAIAVSYPNLYARLTSSERVGDISRSYERSSFPRADEYATTRFGIEFLRLRRQLGLSAQVI